MKKNEKDYERVFKLNTCRDVRDKEDKIVGCVCVGPGKDFGKRDIVHIPTEGKSKPFRSITETMNALEKLDVPYEERKDTFAFISERLRALELEEISKGLKFGPLSGEEKQKRKVEEK